MGEAERAHARPPSVLTDPSPQSRVRGLGVPWPPPPRVRLRLRLVSRKRRGRPTQLGSGVNKPRGTQAGNLRPVAYACAVFASLEEGRGLLGRGAGTVRALKPPAPLLLPRSFDPRHAPGPASGPTWQPFPPPHPAPPLPWLARAWPRPTALA